MRKKLDYQQIDQYISVAHFCISFIKNKKNNDNECFYRQINAVIDSRDVGL